MNYYNEIEPLAEKWLAELMADGQIPEGKIDTRDIRDIPPNDLDGFTQCHFFAGVGGWAYALRLAGWPDDRPVWTGSCPCQPFSVAGKGEGLDDERHLWPAFRWLIAQRRPATVLGEQVASKDGRGWLHGVRTDLEVMGYAVGAADLCAAGVGAPHIRQRLWWVAQSGINGRGEGGAQDNPRKIKAKPHKQRPDGGMADSDDTRPQGRDRRKLRECSEQRPFGAGSASNFWSTSILIPCADGKSRRVPGRVADPKMSERRGLHKEHAGRRDEEAGGSSGISDAGYAENTLEIEPALFPLADGIPNRVGILRGAGNAIVPQVAAEFIMAFNGTAIRKGRGRS